MRTNEQAAGVRSTDGQGRKSDAGRAAFHAQHTAGAGAGQGPAHGAVHGGVWRKRVRGSLHMLRFPKPAWCIDLADLEAAEAVGAYELRISDVETGTEYVTSLAKMRERGQIISRGAGRQVALALGFWRQEGVEQQQEGERAVQLSLFGGRL